MAENKLDELLGSLGTGWWNIIHYVVLCFSLSVPAYHAMGGAFLAPNVEYSCVPASFDKSGIDFDNIPQDEIYNRLGHNGSFLNDCEYLIEDEETGKTRKEICSHWIFDNSTFTSTVTSEFQLTCDRAYLRATYQSMFMLGVFFGAIVSGFSADRYGRKTSTAVGLFLFIILASVSCWIPNLTALLFFRFVLGFFDQFFCTICYILVVEISEPRLRPALGIMSMLPWAVAQIIWGGVAYLIRQWRWLQFAISIPGVLVFPFFWLMDESPRWLAVVGRPERALKVIKRAARLNRKSLPSDDEILSILRESRQKEDQLEHERKPEGMRGNLCQKLDGITILVKTPKIRKIALTVYVAYLIASMVYYGLSLSGGNLSDNPFVYMVLAGLMEIPAYTLTVPIVARFGRKMPTLISFALSAVALLAIAPTPSSCGWLIITLAMVGKLAITSAYQILIFYSTELFPTEVRSRGIGTSYTMSRIGSIISPFINEILGASYPWAPAVVFGVMSVIASLVLILLPETMGTALPETVAELENRQDDDTVVFKKNRTWLPVPTSEKHGNKDLTITSDS